MREGCSCFCFTNDLVWFELCYCRVAIAVLQGVLLSFPVTQWRDLACSPDYINLSYLSSGQPHIL